MRLRCGLLLRCRIRRKRAILCSRARCSRTALVVGVGVSYPCLGKHEAVADEEFQDGRGFGRVDADGMVAVLYHRNVVVG